MQVQTAERRQEDSDSPRPVAAIESSYHGTRGIHERKRRDLGRVVLKEAATAKLAGWPPPRPPGGSGTEEAPAKTAEGLCGAEGRAKSPKEGPKKRLPDDQVRDQVISQDKRRRSGSPRRKRREEGSARKDKSTGRRRDPSEDSSGARSPLGRAQGPRGDADEPPSSANTERKAHAPSAGGFKMNEVPFQEGGYREARHYKPAPGGGAGLRKGEVRTAAANAEYQAPNLRKSLGQLIENK